MHPDVQWLSHQPSPGDCHDREKVLATLNERHRQGVVTGLGDVIEGGEQVFVEVTGPRLEEWGSPDGRACMVVTVRDGRIVRMQDHRSRADALVGAGLAPASTRARSSTAAPVRRSRCASRTPTATC